MSENPYFTAESGKTLHLTYYINVCCIAVPATEGAVIRAGVYLVGGCKVVIR